MHLYILLESFVHFPSWDKTEPFINGKPLYKRCSSQFIYNGSLVHSTRDTWLRKGSILNSSVDFASAAHVMQRMTVPAPRRTSVLKYWCLNRLQVASPIVRRTFMSTVQYFPDEWLNVHTSVLLFSKTPVIIICYLYFTATAVIQHQIKSGSSDHSAAWFLTQNYHYTN